MAENVTGIILAGGQSRRMGRNKALIEIGGRKCIEHVLAAVQQICDEVMIIANTADFEYLGVNVYQDRIQGCGPLGGIYTGLSMSQTERNLVVACDLPCVTPELLRYLCDVNVQSEIVLPRHDGRLEPLCAVYSKQCAQKFAGFVAKGQLRMEEAVKRCNATEMPISSAQEFYQPSLFFNLNSLSELKVAQREMTNES